MDFDLYEEAYNEVSASTLPGRVFWYFNEYGDKKDVIIEAFVEAVKTHLYNMKVEMEENH